MTKIVIKQDTTLAQGTATNPFVTGTIIAQGLGQPVDLTVTGFITANKVTGFSNLTVGPGADLEVVKAGGLDPKTSLTLQSTGITNAGTLILDHPGSTFSSGVTIDSRIGKVELGLKFDGFKFVPVEQASLADPISVNGQTLNKGGEVILTDHGKQVYDFANVKGFIGGFGIVNDMAGHTAIQFGH